MKLTEGKWKTRDGRLAVVVGASSKFAMTGMILDDGAWVTRDWNLDGKLMYSHNPESPSDIIGPWEEPKPESSTKPEPATNDGGPAFPVPVVGATDGRTHDGGMSLRDWFAGQALVGEITHQGLEGRVTDHIAGMAYEMADAMLKARGAK